MRIFIEYETACKILNEIEPDKLDLLVNATNEFLDGYLDKDVFVNSIIELSAIKIIKYWSKLDSNITAITDVDVHLEYDTKYADFAISPEIESMLAPYISNDSISISNSFKFL